MKIKNLILVVWLRKQIITQKLVKLNQNLLIIIKKKNITTPEFNRLIAEVFDARLARANLVARQILMMNLKDKIKKLTQPKQNTCFWKWTYKAANIWFNSFQRQKLFWRKWYAKLFSISANVQIFEKELKVLVVIVIFISRDLRDCLMKILQVLL